MPAYLRFVVADIHRNSGKELGVFHAVLRLRERGKLYAHEEELHDSTRQWFNENSLGKSEKSENRSEKPVLAVRC